MRKAIFFLAVILAIVMAAPLVAFTPGAPPGSPLVMADLAPFEATLTTIAPKAEATMAQAESPDANYSEASAIPDVYLPLRAMLAGLSCSLALILIIYGIKGSMQRVKLADRVLRYARDQCLC